MDIKVWRYLGLDLPRCEVSRYGDIHVWRYLGVEIIMCEYLGVVLSRGEDHIISYHHVIVYWLCIKYNRICVGMHA